MRAAATHEQEQGSALGVSALHYCRETALRGGAAEDSADLEVRR
jgi:hypothetical protein